MQNISVKVSAFGRKDKKVLSKVLNVCMNSCMLSATISYQLSKISESKKGLLLHLTRVSLKSFFTINKLGV